MEVNNLVFLIALINLILLTFFIDNGIGDVIDFIKRKVDVFGKKPHFASSKFEIKWVFKYKNTTKFLLLFIAWGISLWKIYLEFIK